MFPVKVAPFLKLFALCTLLLLFTGCATMSMLPLESGEPADPSLATIEERGRLIVGTDAPYGLMEFYDESGELVGIDMEIAAEIASEIGVEMTVQTMPFDDLFDAVKNGDVDIVISAVTITQERQQEMLFSVPYLDAGMTIAVREDNTSVESLDDLKDKRIGVLKGTVGEDLASESDYFDPSLVVRYEKNDERMQALLDAEIDAAVVHFLDKEQPSIKMIGEPLSQSYYGIVSAIENKALMDEIDTILRQMKRSDRLHEIRRTYLGESGE